MMQKECLRAIAKVAGAYLASDVAAQEADKQGGRLPELDAAERVMRSAAALHPTGRHETIRLPGRNRPFCVKCLRSTGKHWAQTYCGCHQSCHLREPRSGTHPANGAHAVLVAAQPRLLC